MKHLLICAVAAALVAPTFAQAATPPADTTVIKVSGRGLDLSRGKDAEAMLGRLQDAALQACGASSFSLREYQAAVRKSACYAGSLGRAVDALGAPGVTAIYSARMSPAGPATQLGE